MGSNDGFQNRNRGIYQQDTHLQRQKNKYCASKPHLPLSFLITLVAYSCRLGRRPYARMRRVCDLAVCAPLAKEFLGGRWSRGQGGS